MAAPSREELARGPNLKLERAKHHINDLSGRIDRPGYCRAAAPTFRGPAGSFMSLPRRLSLNRAFLYGPRVFPVWQP